MRQFTERPVYQGAKYEVGQVPGGVHARDLANPAMEQDAQAFAQNLASLENEFKRNEDAAQALEEDTAMRLVDERYTMEFDRKLQLANGADGSFFNADGTRNEVAFQNFISGYNKEIDAVTRGTYWTPQVGLAATQKRDARKALFPVQMEALRGQYTRDRGMKAFSDSYELAMEQNNYMGAKTAIDTALAAGLISEKEAQLRKLRVAKSCAQKQAAASNSPRAVEASTLAALLGDMPNEESDAESVLAVPQLTLSVPVEGVQEVEPQAITLKGNLDAAKFDEALLTGDADALFSVGVRAESDGEVVAQLEDAARAHGRLRLVEDSSTGKMLPVFNSDTHDSMAAHAVKARKVGGMTLSAYKDAIWGAGLDLLNSPETEGMNKDSARKAWLSRVTVYGLEDELFDGNEEAMTALLDSTFEKLYAARDAEIAPRVKSLVQGGKEGLPGTGGMLGSNMDAKILARFNPSEEVEALSKVDFGWLPNTLAFRKEVGKGFSSLYSRYREQYLMETGQWEEMRDAEKRGTQVAGAELTSEDTMEGFRDWFFSPNGAYSKMKEDYLRSVRELCTQKATEAVAARRQMTGEENWAEEQKLIIQVVEKEIGNLDGSPDPYSAYRADRESDLRSRASSYHDKYMRDYKPALEQAKAKGEALKAEEVAAAEADKEAADAKKNAEKAHATRYTRTNNYTLSYKKDSTDDEAPTLYVPVEEYRDMVSQLGVKRGHGVVCTINGGDTMFAVMPSKQKGMSYNAAAFNKIYGERKRKGMTAAQLQHAVRGVPHKVTFKQF